MSPAPAPDKGPPDLPGYRFLELLGVGGNAHVYLYEQQMPRRKVAVKVLDESGLTESAVRRFTDEANVTAGLGNHPHIVQVFGADVTPDGRPYLVMEYYPRANLSIRARREHFPVADVLKTGIQIGSAVETSHRGGILHRDIKPQNILTGQFGAPALTDFGIATAKGADGPEGMSVPWSPPEVLYGTSPGDERSDVYSLGATLWHLLAGHSPFEQPGGDNGRYALMGRIKSDPVPRTGRGDVPESLERLLRQAMAKDPVARPQTALDFIRALQAVEQELRLPLTDLVLPADEAPPPGRPGGRAAGDGGAAHVRGGHGDGTWSPADDNSEATFVRGPRRIDPWPSAPPPGIPGMPPAAQHTAGFTGGQSGRHAAAAMDEATWSRGTAPAEPWGGLAAAPPRDRFFPAEVPEAATTVRPARIHPDFTAPAAQDTGAAAGPSRSRSGRVVAVVGGALVVAAAAGAVLAFRQHSGGQPAAQATQSAGNNQAAGNNQNAIGSAVTAPGTPRVAATRANSQELRFTWTYTNPMPGKDTFQWRRITGGSGHPDGTAKEPSLLVAASRGQTVCVTVRVVRATGEASDWSAATCWPR